MFETILEKYSIEVVVNRTKISRKNLEKLKNGNFEGFTRPQAYGFIRILEREFNESFDDLKREMDAWFEELPSEISEPIFQREDHQEEGSSRKWIVAGLAAMVLLLGFYLFQKEFASPSQKEAESRIAVTTKNITPVQKAEKHGSDLTPEDRGAAMEKSIASPAESNMTQEPAAKAAEQGGAQPAKEKAEPEPYVPLEDVALTPVIKLWFGIIDLKTKKRLAKVSDAPYEIESRGKKLIVTGHGRFEISDAFGNLFKFNDAKKHYFLIDDGMVKEIAESEFRRLNGGKGW